MDNVWMFVVAMLLSIIGFLVVWVLNSIRGEMRDIKGTLGALEHDLRGGVAALDRRVAVLESHYNRDGQ